MIVKLATFKGTTESRADGSAEFTPELFASVGARFSRNNEGWDAIVSKIDMTDESKAVDAIFKFVDYGHASIADMVPVAMVFEGISFWTAFKLWKYSPQGSGQESSSRYIEMSDVGVVRPTSFDLCKHFKDFIFFREKFEEFIKESFEMYAKAQEFWADYLSNHPEDLKFPTKCSKLVKERITRNYIFDRARYFLPSAGKTNMVLLQSARAWTELLKNLQVDSATTEEREVAKLIISKLELIAPRMVKHTSPAMSHYKVRRNRDFHLDLDTPYEPFLSVSNPQIDLLKFDDMVESLSNRENRYSPCGDKLSMMSVTYGWSKVAFAELRDLNRHRTGSKYIPQIPSGVYCAQDLADGEYYFLKEGEDFLRKWGNFTLSLINDGNHLQHTDYPLFTSLGTCFPYYHTTTGDKYIYTSELRTGTGSHPKYAQLFRDSLALFYKKYPETYGVIQEGLAEPE